MNNIQYVCQIISINRLKKLAQTGLIPCDSDRNRIDGFPGPAGGNDLKRRFIHPLHTWHAMVPADFVRFYFTGHPLLLKQIETGKRPETEYRSGAVTMLRLVSEFDRVLNFAEQTGRKILFTDGNSGSSYFNEFITFNENTLAPESELLLEGYCPFQLVQEIRVFVSEMKTAAEDALRHTLFSGIPVVCMPEAGGVW